MNSEGDLYMTNDMPIIADMPKTIEGELSADGYRFSIVVARFNSFISSRLLAGALDALQRHGANMSQVEVVWVPGAFEIPLVAQKVADPERTDAVICLGAIIRGETPHFDYVAAENAKGIAMVSLSSRMPVTYGVITADTTEQAIERAGTKAGNKGYDAAVTAIEMVNLMDHLES